MCQIINDFLREVELELKEILMVKPRNRGAAAPIMRKGGAHGRSRKAQRRAANLQVQREARSW